MRSIILSAIFALCAILAVYASMIRPGEPIENTDNPHVLSRTLEIPDYVFTIEYQLAAQKTFIAQFDREVTPDMIEGGITWLGYCYSVDAVNEVDPRREPMIRSGDKVKWGGEIFCLKW